VNNAPNDAELGRLLTQLLRLVSPAAGDGAAAVAVAPDGAGPAVPPGPDGVPVMGIPQVSGSEARALIELVQARGIAQGELAGLLGLEKSTVSRLAAGLERKGWVRRGRDEGNQRYVRLYLTAEGGAVAARLWDAWQSRQARILAALTIEERAGLSAGLRGLVRGLAAEGLLGEVPLASPEGRAPESPAPAGPPAGRSPAG
jgi:DNA-binding MarR family transcriptional regulator